MVGASVPALLLWLSLSCAPCSGWLGHDCGLAGTVVGGGVGFSSYTQRNFKQNSFAFFWSKVIWSI